MSQQLPRTSTLSEICSHVADSAPTASINLCEPLVKNVWLLANRKRSEQAASKDVSDTYFLIQAERLILWLT